MFGLNKIDPRYEVSSSQLVWSSVIGQELLMHSPAEIAVEHGFEFPPLPPHSSPLLVGSLDCMNLQCSKNNHGDPQNSERGGRDTC